jgi:hypothetical protein
MEDTSYSNTAGNTNIKNQLASFDNASELRRNVLSFASDVGNACQSATTLFQTFDDACSCLFVVRGNVVVDFLQVGTIITKMAQFLLSFPTTVLNYSSSQWEVNMHHDGVRYCLLRKGMREH